MAAAVPPAVAATVQQQGPHHHHHHHQPPLTAGQHHPRLNKMTDLTDASYLNPLNFLIQLIEIKLKLASVELLNVLVVFLHLSRDYNWLSEGTSFSNATTGLNLKPHVFHFDCEILKTAAKMTAKHKHKLPFRRNKVLTFRMLCVW